MTPSLSQLLYGFLTFLRGEGDAYVAAAAAVDPDAVGAIVMIMSMLLTRKICENQGKKEEEYKKESN